MGVVVDKCKSEFVRLLSETAPDGNRARVFADFLKIAACAYAHFEKNPAKESLYIGLINSYNPRGRQNLVQMNALLVLMARSSKYRDVLGEIYRELKMERSNDGQVFTPEHICKLMGDLVLGDSTIKDVVDAELKKYGHVTFKEPCCGSGAIVLGALAELSELGINPKDKAVVEASDLDENCVLMTYIQMTLYEIAAEVKQQDALSDAVYSTWRTMKWRRGNEVQN